MLRYSVDMTQSGLIPFPYMADEIVNKADENNREYEISFLLRTPESLSDVINLFIRHGATVSNENQLKQIRLAYPIKKHEEAFLGFATFTASAGIIRKLRDDLAFIEPLLRFLIITPPIKSPVRQRRPIMQHAPESKQIERNTPAPVLSNEGLKQKLEEILK